MKNSKSIKFLMVFAFISLLSSCTKDDAITESDKTEKANNTAARLPGDPIIGPDIYYAITTPGTVVNGGGAFCRAILDVNENHTSLSNFDSGALCVTVSSTEDVYVGGWERQTNGISSTQFPAKVWKNGVTYFTGNANSTPVSCIIKDFDNIYFTTGNEIYQNDQLLYSLTNSLGQCTVRSIYLFNGDIYACGEIANAGVAVWKNGVLLYLFPQDAANPNYILGESIFVDNTGIYTFGQIAGYPKIWKNSIKINLPEDYPSQFSYDTYNPYGTNGLRSIVSIGQDILIPGCTPPTIANSSFSAKLYKMNKSTKVISTYRTYPQNTGAGFLFSFGNSVYTTVSSYKLYKENFFVSNKQRLDLLQGKSLSINSFFVKGI